MEIKSGGNEFNIVLWGKNLECPVSFNSQPQWWDLSMGYEALDKNAIWEKVAHLPRKVDSEGSQRQRPNLRINVFILTLSVAVFQSNWGKKKTNKKNKVTGITGVLKQ